MQGSISVRLVFDRSSSDALALGASSLRMAMDNFPALEGLVRGMLLDDEEKLRPGLVEVYSVPPDVDGALRVGLRMSRRFRAIVAAAAAGDEGRLRGLMASALAHSEAAAPEKEPVNLEALAGSLADTAATLQRIAEGNKPAAPPAPPPRAPLLTRLWPGRGH